MHPLIVLLSVAFWMEWLLKAFFPVLSGVLETYLALLLLNARRHHV